MFLNVVLSQIPKDQKVLTMMNLVSFFEFSDSSFWEDCLCFSNGMDPDRDNTREHFVWV